MTIKYRKQMNKINTVVLIICTFKSKYLKYIFKPLYWVLVCTIEYLSTKLVLCTKLAVFKKESIYKTS